MGTYNFVRLPENVNKCCWINFKIDAVFLNTNASQFDYDFRVVPPKFPLYHRILGHPSFENSLQRLAIGDSLWLDREFLNWGSDVRTQEEFKRSVCMWALGRNAKKLQVVRVSSRLEKLNLPEMGFVESHDPVMFPTVPVCDLKVQFQQCFQGKGCSAEFEVVEVDTSSMVNNSEMDGEPDESMGDSETYSDSDASEIMVDHGEPNKLSHDSEGNSNGSEDDKLATGQLLAELNAPKE